MLLRCLILLVIYCTVLIKRLESCTIAIKQHVQFICNSHSTTMCVYPVDLANIMLSLWHIAAIHAFRPQVQLVLVVY